MKVIDCPECGAQLYPGTLFCELCVAAVHPAVREYLANSSAAKPKPPVVPGGKLVTVAGPATRPVEPVLPPAVQTPALRANIVQHRTELVLRSTSINVGRTDPFADFVPELDLSRFGGQERGVSRRHATIRWEGNGFVIIDNHSSNGTWLDGARLEAGRAYPLPPVANVRFGGLLVQLSLAD